MKNSDIFKKGLLYSGEAALVGYGHYKVITLDAQGVYVPVDAVLIKLGSMEGDDMFGNPDYNIREVGWKRYYVHAEEIAIIVQNLTEEEIDGAELDLWNMAHYVWETELFVRENGDKTQKDVCIKDITKTEPHRVPPPANESTLLDAMMERSKEFNNNKGSSWDE
jgi:hypothetical protein